MHGLTGEATRTTPLASLRRWIQAHERRLIVAWFAGWIVFFGAVFAWGIWARGLERVVVAWNARTGERLAHAEQLIAAKDWEKAKLELIALDADHPAIQVKHRLDKERERVLELLGLCFEETDHKKKAIATLQRLVAFDPRNWHNHFVLAETLAHFNEHDLAEAQYREVLRIHPSHFPTVSALTGMLYDVATLYAKVVELHQQYLNGYLLAPVELRFGDRKVVFDVPVDGNPHALEAPLELAAGFSGDATIATHGYSVRIGALELIAPEHVGVVDAPQPVVVDGASGWSAQDADAIPAGEVAALSQDARYERGLERPVSAGPGQFAAKNTKSSFHRRVDAPLGASRVKLELTLYKHMDLDTWAKIVNSYGCRLEWTLLEDAKRRTVVGGCLEAGSTFED